eukprot:6948737-Lingulodinium_polyedra.AAC.1
MKETTTGSTIPQSRAYYWIIFGDGTGQNPAKSSKSPQRGQTQETCRSGELQTRFHVEHA